MMRQNRNTEMAREGFNNEMDGWNFQNVELRQGFLLYGVWEILAF
jgi:hypothetical protein